MLIEPTESETLEEIDRLAHLPTHILFLSYPSQVLRRHDSDTKGSG
jgi:glycine cleavage system protein P-like pyridoxal-binding family